MTVALSLLVLTSDGLQRYEGAGHRPQCYPRSHRYRPWSRRLVVIVAFVSATANCGGGGGPTTPSGTPASTIDDLVGDWSATIVTVTDSCYRFTWSPKPGAGGVTGPLGPDNVGTFTGTLSNGTLSLVLDLPAGSVGQNACAVTGSGTASASQTEIIGNFRLNFTQACVGIVMAPTSNDCSQPGTLTMRTSSLSPPACPPNSRIFD